MNGEVKSYRLNEPMTWKEFKGLPDDIKVTYIKLLREKWGVPDSHIADMMKCNKATISIEMKRLGLNGWQRNKCLCDTEGFKAWAYGVPAMEAEPVQAVKDDSSTAIPEEVIEEPEHETITVKMEKPVIHPYSARLNYEAEPVPAVPQTGNMVFEGKTEEVLRTIGFLLGGADVHISITWDVL